MNTRLSTTAAACALAASVFSHGVVACSIADLRGVTGGAQDEASARFAASIEAAQQARAANPRSAPSEMTGRAAHGAIVGLWRFAFTAPDGGSIDWGFQTWHSDGTEITNSGSRPAKNGDFCMGVWEQYGTGTYVLNHWAIAWGLPPDFDENTLSGLVNIRERVNIDPTANTMTGTVSLDLYDVDGTTLLGHIVDGSVSGTRVTPE